MREFIEKLFKIAGMITIPLLAVLGMIEESAGKPLDGIYFLLSAILMLLVTYDGNRTK